DQVINIPDTTLTASFSLQNLNLANQTIIYPLSLGQMCQQLGIAGILIIAANGSTATIPEINITTGDNDINATEFFQSADLESGFIDLTLKNELPIVISNMVFQVRNKIDQQILTQDTFVNLMPQQTQVKTINLSGKHVEGTLTAQILDLNSPGGNVLIDTSNSLIITMTAHDLVVNTATAVFPAQNIIEQDQQNKYNLSGGAELNELRIKSGTLLMNLKSTIQQQSHLEFSLPSATDMFGNSISVSEDIPAAPVGGTSDLNKTFDLAGYSFNLTGLSGTEHNTYFTHLVASIDSTGALVTISKEDSVIINYTLQDIVPEYVQGYLGQQIINIGPSQTPFEGFKNIVSGSLGLEQADVSLSIVNAIGVSGRINIYDLTSVNTLTENSVPLTWNLLSTPLDIPPATDNPFLPSFTIFDINNSNSNFTTLVENLPDQLQYSLDIFINPSGNVSNYMDFAYDTSAISVNLNLSVPLSFIANDLVLQDTFDFSLGSPEEGDPIIKEGTFNLIADNGFPFTTSSQLYFYDDQMNFLDSLFTSPNTIAAAILNDACLVAEKTTTVLTMNIDENKMNRLRNSKKVIIRSSFNTSSTSACSSYLKIYNYYLLGIKLTGSFTYYTGF
ncbi:MAG: hypothetical protein H0V65_08005, partial [Chitinophagales bacterium]|nr:hypothetical protein [Chitinophagales bacterium]